MSRIQSRSLTGKTFLNLFYKMGLFQLIDFWHFRSSCMHKYTRVLVDSPISMDLMPVFTTISSPRGVKSGPRGDVDPQGRRCPLTLAPSFTLLFKKTERGT
jgi:hypothetical protein